MKNIVNIINFVRAVEPRDDKVDLFGTLKNELDLSQKYGFPTTVLFQYDAMIDNKYIDLIKQYSCVKDIGIWLEIVQPLAEDSGIEWHGRWSWDWHNDVGFSIGYTSEQRKTMIDTFFNRFKDIFGYYPESAGSWHIDAVTLAYMKEKYDIKASCNCKDQYGTDGYTMWGGYYNGAYYPSKYNMLCPAQTQQNQINVPVFRMLGSDPVRQYDIGMEQTVNGEIIYDPTNCQGVASLEPVYDNAGANEQWVKWYLDQNFNGKSISFGYTQAGQENSFGWEGIKKGLPMQFEIMTELIKQNKIEIMTLADSGKWFSKNYKTTPPASICIDKDIPGENNRTAWYYNNRYRVNLFNRDNMLWIRDFYLFDENFKEKYLDRRESSNNCGYFNLPVMDGFRYSKDKIRAGIYPCADGKVLTFSPSYQSDTSDGNLKVSLGDLSFTMTENCIEISCGVKDWYLEFKTGDNSKTTFTDVENNCLNMKFRGYTDCDYKYKLTAKQGCFKREADSTVICCSENGKIVFSV